MTQFDRITLGRQARELGFVRDTFEKVCRLADVLAFLESDALLSKTLAHRFFQAAAKVPPLVKDVNKAMTRKQQQHRRKHGGELYL